MEGNKGWEREGNGAEEEEGKIFVSNYYEGIEKRDVLDYLQNQKIAHTEGTGSNIWAVVKYCFSCPPHNNKPDNLWKVNIYKVPFSFSLFLFFFFFHFSLLFFSFLFFSFLFFLWSSFGSHPSSQPPPFPFFLLREANTTAIVVLPTAPGLTSKKNLPPTTPPPPLSPLSPSFPTKMSAPTSPPLLFLPLPPLPPQKEMSVGY